MPLPPRLLLLGIIAGVTACGDATAPGASGPRTVLLTAAADFTCAVDSLGHAWCWGDGLNGQLGNGDTMIRRIPQPMALPLELRQISAGDYHACGLTEDDRAWCWGTNFIGVLGIGQLTGREPVPLQVAGGIRFASIAAGNAHTCGLDRDGAAWCWGQGEFGRLGVGDTLDRLQPAQVQTATRFTQIASGGAHTCARTAQGEAWCWGANFRGQLGTGDTLDAALPRPVGGGHQFRAVEVGNYHSCGLLSNGQAWCWGNDLTAELGSGVLDPAPVTLPVPVAGGRVFEQLSVGREHACGVTRAGAAWCWGSSIFGKLGNDDFLPTAVPVAVAGGFQFARIAAAGNHTCAATLAGTIYCWGRNSLGQFGNGGGNDALSPTPALPLLVP